MSNPLTSQTLLQRLRKQPHDPESWQEFVTRYGPLVLKWCNQWGLQRSDADDVSQEVMLDLARQMAKYEHDPQGRFRSWLKTIAYRAWCDFIARRSRNKEVSSVEVAQLVGSQDACSDLLNRLDQELQKQLFEEASTLVRIRVEPKTWSAFEMTAHQGMKGEAVANALNMAVATVYVARSKVTRMIREEVERLGGKPD